MKIITTLICILGFQYISSGQTATTPPVPNAAACSLVYSEDSKSLKHSEALPVKSRDLIIASLPPLTQSLTTITLDFGMTGAFTFKKEANLNLQDDRDIYIEDMLTGKIFDLKKSDSYTFNVTRRIPDRFVLHIDKMIFKYAVSGN